MSCLAGLPQTSFPFLYPVWYTDYEYAATGRKKEFGYGMKTKLGIVGCGFLGNIVADAWKKGLLPDYELVGVTSLSLIHI